MERFCKQGHDTFVTGRYKSGQCKQCIMDWKRNNSEKVKTSAIKYYRKNSKKLLTKHLQWKKNNPKRNQKHWLERNWRNHKIINSDGSPFTQVDYDRLYQIQQGKCAICKRHQNCLGKILSVDHNHKTKLVRGLLCTSCNHAIGLFKESPEVFQNATKYLVNKV